jgi:hypothetical protein
MNVQSASAAQNCIYLYNLTVFILSSLNVHVVVSVAFILQQRERRKYVDHTIPSCVSLYTCIKEPSLLRYKVHNPLISVRTWANDLVQGYRRVKCACTVNPAAEVCLSLVAPVHWFPSKSRRARIHVSKKCGRRKIRQQRGVIYKAQDRL